jgi:hypothetical protein
VLTKNPPLVPVSHIVIIVLLNVKLLSAFKEFKGKVNLCSSAPTTTWRQSGYSAHQTPKCIGRHPWLSLAMPILGPFSVRMVG